MNVEGRFRAMPGNSRAGRLVSPTHRNHHVNSLPIGLKLTPAHRVGNPEIQECQTGSVNIDLPFLPSVPSAAVAAAKAAAGSVTADAGNEELAEEEEADPGRPGDDDLRLATERKQTERIKNSYGM